VHTFRRWNVRATSDDQVFMPLRGWMEFGGTLPKAFAMGQILSPSSGAVRPRLFHQRKNRRLQGFAGPVDFRADALREVAPQIWDWDTSADT
jgi:hypothetical protein